MPPEGDERGRVCLFWEYGQPRTMNPCPFIVLDVVGRASASRFRGVSLHNGSGEGSYLVFGGSCPALG